MPADAEELSLEPSTLPLLRVPGWQWRLHYLRRRVWGRRCCSGGICSRACCRCWLRRTCRRWCGRAVSSCFRTIKMAQYVAPCPQTGMLYRYDSCEAAVHSEGCVVRQSPHQASQIMRDDTSMPTGLLDSSSSTSPVICRAEQDSFAVHMADGLGSTWRRRCCRGPAGFGNWRPPVSAIFACRWPDG